MTESYSNDGPAPFGSFLFFDTETTGLPKNYNAPISDLGNWPRLIQIAWAVYGIDGTELGASEHFIRPDGFQIPQAATSLHGITTSFARENGIELRDALQKFSQSVSPVKTLVGHNIAFDENILGAEFLRCKMDNLIIKKQRICTMHSSVNYCKLPGRYGYKWPGLQELYKILFHADVATSHTALADVRTTARCFFELKKLGVINSPG